MRKLDLDLGTILASRYQIDTFIGYGWNLIYYRANQLDIPRRVIVEILQPDYLADDRMKTLFLNETRLIASLEHQHIIPLYDFGDHQGHPFRVTRYIERGSLKRLIPRQQEIPILEKLRMLKEIAEVLDFIHSIHIVHGGIKPANLLIDARDRVHLTGFQSNHKNQMGSHLGPSEEHYPYVSVEYLEGRALTSQSDIFGLAATAFALLTGNLPFHALTIAEHIHSRRNSDSHFSAAAGDYPSDVESISTKALHPDTEIRHQSATEFTSALESALQRNISTPTVSVFISYSHEDGDVARQLVDDLTKNYLQVWFDKISIQISEAWEPAIRRGIRESDKFIVILSPDAVESEYVQAEVDYAKEKGKPIIPIIHRLCDIPLNIRLLQNIDFTREGYSRGIEILLRAVLAQKTPPEL